ncbi:Trp biosynthesis-associated membrane protein [Cellulomonas sp. S1-8]|uniref:Trp biosynthesis-associated membrane protein n=1 Tax=Cellulomonas sp. S1-8 TaxID=2904790 RepID=UPI00224373F0|nr:Trp biosynthesis-associated membrane protein [Cellulomonas sp. S1-8]UZN01585.1 Trp biosynthesis-associated membrane protein [Cellulomonas sp. S1-8]
MTGAAAHPGPVAPARRGRWVLALLLAAGVVGLVTVPTWVTGSGTSVLDGAVTVTVDGAAAAPQAPAAALVLLAAAGALALVGRAGRWVVAAVSAGAGVLVLAAGAAVLADPSGAVSGAVADATGVTGASGATTTAGPAAAVVVGVLVVLLAVALARAPGAWDHRSRRHERPVGPDTGGTDPGAADERADWDALTRGDDPS